MNNIIEKWRDFVNNKRTRRDHVLILKGKRGKRIFEKIMNGPKVPFTRLRKEVDEAIANILDDRENGDR